MIHYVDCGEGLVFPSNNTVNGRILPDELHPNTEGYRKLAACLGPVVDDLVACESLLPSFPTFSIGKLTPKGLQGWASLMHGMHDVSPRCVPDIVAPYEFGHSAYGVHSVVFSVFWV